MRETRPSCLRPALPYLLFHPKFVEKHSGAWWERLQQMDVFNEAWWAGPGCFAIDVNCRKFPLLEVANAGPSWTGWNLLHFGPWRKFRLYKAVFVFGPPDQLTFEQARQEFVEYVCLRRWWSASYETEQQFRVRNAAYANMRDLLEPVSLKGKWPWDKSKSHR